MTQEPLRLVGAHEIRLMLGNISRQRSYQLTSRSDFPAPAANLEQGKIWLTDEVAEWIANKRPASSAGWLPRAARP